MATTKQNVITASVLKSQVSCLKTSVVSNFGLLYVIKQIKVLLQSNLIVFPPAHKWGCLIIFRACEHTFLSMVLCCVCATNVDFGSENGKLTYSFAESTFFLTSDILAQSGPWAPNIINWERHVLVFLFCGQKCQGDAKAELKHVCDWRINLFAGFFVNLINHRALEDVSCTSAKILREKITWRDRYIWGPVIRCHVITQVGLEN